MKLNIRSLALLASLFFGIALIYLASSFNKPTNNEPESSEIIIVEESPALFLFNIQANGYNINEKSIKRNEFLSTLLSEFDIDAVKISQIAKKSKPIFDVRKMSAGKTITTLTEKSDSTKLAYFIYQPNAIDYIVYDLRDSINIYAEQKDVTTEIQNIQGTVESSLYQALEDSGSSPDLAFPLAQIFGGVVNFYAIQPGDWFRIQYESQSIDDEVIGLGKIKSAIFSHKGKEHEAFYFKPEGTSEGSYYDNKGNSLQRAFLKAPLKYSRISSRYSGRRLHPVQKVWKAHLGTDFAAPHGTPIIATANGVVTESQFGRGNGNYVKVKHNKTYTTQYLHMSKRAVKRGQRITQGQVIGYVGSTGLATGPHVCYRFWENGRQVDALKKNFKSSEPIDSKYQEAFAKLVRFKQQQLANASSFEKEEEIVYTAYQDGPPALFKYFGKI